MKTSNLRCTRFNYSYRVSHQKAQTTRQWKYLRAFGLATALLTLAGPEPAIARDYSLDFLIHPYHPGVVDSWFFDINNQGQSTGYMVEWTGNTFQTNAVIYRDGISQVLASWGGFNYPPGVQGISLNNLGEAIGINSSYEPFFFGVGGTAIPITIPDSGVFPFAFGGQSGGLNDSGNFLIGFYPNDPLTLPPGGFAGLALWSRLGTTTLSVLDPLYPYLNPPDPEDFNSGPSSSAYSGAGTPINNANQFAAAVFVFDYDPVDPDNPDDDTFSDRFTYAYIYDGIGGYSILQNPTPGEELRPINTDETGTVFGWVGNRLALWGLDGAFQTFLPDPAEPLAASSTFSTPKVQRNNLGQVVAVSLDRGLLFYDPITNAWTDITPSIYGLDAGTLFGTVQGFNDQGQFIGLARPPQGGGSFAYVISPIPEPRTIGSVVVNDGSAQRSMINSLTVTFDGAAILDPGAIELHREDGTLVNTQIEIPSVNGNTVAVLTFSSAEFAGGSLDDGSYTLTVLADRVHDQWGRELDGDGDGTAGGDGVGGFHRLFGDSDGDGDVDHLDRGLFRPAKGTTAADAGYLWYFDSDGDGDVDGLDNGRFNRRFGQH